ncbi:MAG: hypothetical protein Q8K71_02265 [Polaromonas sp.]|nr:hypothetical protein [Polaromonas sp.]
MDRNLSGATPQKKVVYSGVSIDFDSDTCATKLRKDSATLQARSKGLCLNELSHRMYSGNLGDHVTPLKVESSDREHATEVPFHFGRW